MKKKLGSKHKPYEGERNTCNDHFRNSFGRGISEDTAQRTIYD
jgi:hypothetical protein